MKSMWRHFMDVWASHRCVLGGGGCTPEHQEEALCAVIFNASGYLHELLKLSNQVPAPDPAVDTDLFDAIDTPSPPPPSYGWAE